MATQQEINDFVEQIIPYFDPTPVEDDAVQQSWPRLDRGLSDVQDMMRFQHMNGIFGRGGQPYWLRNNGTVANTNATNQKRLTVSTITGTGEATIRGAFHRLRQDILLDFPSVSVATMQHVVLEYDPVRSEAGGDPIEAKVVESLDTTQGKQYLLLWTVDRRPSQLLTDAPVQQYRPFVSSTTTYNYRRHLPDPASLMSGTIARTTQDDGVYMSLQGNEVGPDGESATARWVNVGEPRWFMFNGTGDGQFFNYPGHGARMAWSRHNGVVYMQGRLRRSSGNFEASNTDGYLILTLPEAYRPSSERRFTTASAGYANPSTTNIQILSNGQVRVFVNRTTPWVGFDGINYRAG